MSLQTSSPRIAGQDSDIFHTFFSSSDAPRSLLDAGSSPTSGKQIYGNSESIKSWIGSIGSANTSIFQYNNTADVDVFEFATHPFRTCHLPSPLSDEFESGSGILFPLDASAWAPEVFAAPYYDDSDESHSESSLSDGAQYVTIPSDSLWFRPPSPSPGPFSAFELSTAVYANSCSSDVRQAIAQQELLLTIFYEELRRTLPRDDSAEYNSDWLEAVDVDLLLAPLETYAELCWESAICEKASAVRSEKPIPDVPIGFDELHATY